MPTFPYVVLATVVLASYPFAAPSTATAQDFKGAAREAQADVVSEDPSFVADETRRSGIRAKRVRQPANNCIKVTPRDDVAKILSDAAENASVCLGDGIYRVVTPWRPKKGQKISGSRQAVLSGSTPLTGWVREGNFWVVKGVLPPAYAGVGECEDTASNPCRLRENLFDGDRPVTRAVSLGDLRAGTYFADYSNNRIVLASDPATGSYNLSTSESAIQSNAPSVSLSGFSVRKFATTAQRGAIMAEGPGWVLDGLSVTLSHGKGISFAYSDRSVLKNSIISNNGQLGVGSWRSKDLLITQNTISQNNTDGFWAHDWEAGGVKLFESSGSVATNIVTSNTGIGVWADGDCQYVKITGNRIDGNASDGIRYEISYDGAVLDNTITNNGLRIKRGYNTGSVWVSAGIVISTSNRVEVARNSVSGNLHGVSVQYRERGSGLYGHWDLGGVDVHDNSIDLRRSGSQVGAVGEEAYLAALRDKGTVQFRNNAYNLSAAGTPFVYGWDWMSFAGWQAAGMDPTGSARVS